MDALRERMSAAMDGRLPGMFGVEILSIEHGETETRLALKEEHLAPNDFLHAGTVITLADTSCGMGCLASLPEGAVGFTTIELKTNFLATAREGALRCTRAARARRRAHPGMGRHGQARGGRARDRALSLHAVPAPGRRRSHRAPAEHVQRMKEGK